MFHFNDILAVALDFGVTKSMSKVTREASAKWTRLASYFGLSRTEYVLPSDGASVLHLREVE
jgi:hypothetical protein